MRAFHSAAANAISQPQILVIAHACGILAVVADQRLQTLPRLRGLRPQTLQSLNDLIYLTSPKLLGNVMHPAVGLCGTCPLAEAGKLPRIVPGHARNPGFHNGARTYWARDPLGAVAHNHHHGVEPDLTE